MTTEAPLKPPALVRFRTQEGVEMDAVRVVVLTNHFSEKSTQNRYVIRITPRFYVLYCNHVSMGSKYHRNKGMHSGDEAVNDAWRTFYQKITPDSLAFLEQFAAQHGGTWDNGWRPNEIRPANYDVLMDDGDGGAVLP